MTTTKMLAQINSIWRQLADCAGMKRLKDKRKLVKDAIALSGDDVGDQLVFEAHYPVL